MKKDLPHRCSYFRVIASMLIFFSFVTASNSQIIAESFEGKDFPPPGWEAGPYYAYDPWDSKIGDATHGNNSITITATYNYASGYMKSPAIMLEAGQEVQISFDYSILSIDGTPATLAIYATDGVGEPVYGTQFETLTFTEPTPYTTYFTTYTATETGEYYFYFQVDSPFLHPFDMVMDRIIIQNASECEPVTNVSVNNIIATSATVNWDSAVGISEWQIQVTQGTLPAEANWVDALSEPTVVNTLVPGTYYTVYVRSKCEDEYGYLSGPASFTTPCTDVIPAPYTISFATAQLPNCWSEEGGTPWKFSVFADYGAGDAGDHTLLQGATNYAWVDGSDNTDGEATTLISPTVDISALESPALEFYVYSSTKDGIASNELLVEIFDGAIWQSVATLATSTGGWKFYSLAIDSALENVQARFTVTGNGPLTYYNDILIDDIAFREETTCHPAQNFTSSGVSSTTIEIAWESANADATWDIAYGIYSEVFTGTPDLISVEMPYTITDLEPSTYYYIYARANCSGETGEWEGPFTIMTDCIVYAPPYSQDFTTDFMPPYSFDSPGYPTCWSEAIGGSLTTGPDEYGTGNWKPDRNATAGTVTNSESASVTFFGSTENSWLISPVFDIPGTDHEAKIRIAISASAISPALLSMGSDDEVRFVYSQDGVSWQTLKVWSGEDGNSTGYHTYIVPLDDVTGEVRFAFWTNEGLNDDVMYQFHLDDLELREKSACPEPLNLLADGMTDETAVLSWDSNDEATSWLVAVVAPGVAPSDADWVTVNTNPYEWDGLSADTAYEFYAKSLCGNTTGEIVAGPFAFSTRCTPIMAPYTETFVEYQTVPACWINNPIPVDMQIFAIYFWNYTTEATADAASAGDHTTGGGTNYAWLNTANYINNERAKLTTALVDVSTLENPAFQFYLYSKNNADDALNHVIVKIFSGNAWQELTTITSYTNAWAEHTLDLSAFAGESPVQIQFEILVNANGGYPGYNQILIDDVSFMEMPACPAPFNINIFDITESSAFISWENVSSVNSWEVEYGPTGFTPGDGTVIEVDTTAETTLSSLEDGQTYDVYITASCGSATAGPATFTAETAAGRTDAETFRITCYPNPVSGIINIKSGFMIDRIEIYSVVGQLVKQSAPADTTAAIEIGMLNSGVYLVKAYSGDNVSVFRIIKN